MSEPSRLIDVPAALEEDLESAAAEGQLRVLYQPQVELRGCRMVGVEALIRWEHPRLGLLGPAQFMPMAIETGLVSVLDEWVLRTTCAQAREWDARGLPPLRVAVNTSTRRFEQLDLVDTISEVLSDTGLDARRLELEVTEGVVVDEPHENFRVASRLRALGVRLVIDDFGTGLSMLARLRHFPVETLKIDKVFIDEIITEADDSPLVAAMVAMGHALRLEVVAEGVETEEQLAFLRRHGCDLGQGFLFSRPVAPTEIERLLVVSEAVSA